jgi:CO dehydrogenase/acetyl-CoA synthase alpha subunit
MARRKRAVKVIRPNKREARDEGPRLLPLPDDKPEHQNSKLQHYMNLADQALGERRRRT